MFLPEDLTKLTDIRLSMLFGSNLAGIKSEIRRNHILARLCRQSDKIEDEIARRAFERDKDKAP